jgi:uncharacterized membrane protein
MFKKDALMMVWILVALVLIAFVAALIGPMVLK